MSAGVAFGLLAVGLLLGIILGFIMGVRGKQILASLRSSVKLVAGLTFRVPPTPAADEMGDEGGDDDQLDEEEGGLSGMLDDFLNNESGEGFDDHPDLEVNPVILYQFRAFKEKQKEEKAAEQRRLALEAEGLSVEEIESRLLDNDAGEQAGPKSDKQCALNILIEAGARVTALAASGGAEAQKIQDRRRQLRNIEIYLRQARDISTEKAKARTRNAKGIKVSSAVEIAMATANSRHGGGTFDRVIRNVPVAKASRNILRAWKQDSDARKKQRGEEDPEEWDEASDGEGGKNEVEAMGLQRRAHGGAALNQAELMKLAAELGADMDDEEEEGFLQGSVVEDEVCPD